MQAAPIPAPDEQPRSRSFWAAVVVLMVLAAVVRLFVALPRVGQPPDDPDNYLPLARSLASGAGLQFNGHPTAYRPPLYPLLLVPAVWAEPWVPVTIAVIGSNAVLGGLTVGLIALAARRWELSAARSLVASLLVTFDPVLVAQSRSVMTETPAALLTALILAAVAGRGRWASVVTGFALGLAALCRPSSLPGSLMMAAAAVLADPRGAWGVRIRRCTAMLLGLALSLAPWAVRNASIWGEPVFTTTHGGYTLYLANNPVYYHEVLDGPPGAVWTGQNQKQWFAAMYEQAANLPEPQADRVHARSAWRFIRENPKSFVRASVARLGRFWGLAPAESLYSGRLRLAAAVWTAPFWLAVLVSLAQRANWRWPRVAAVCLIVGLTCVHTVFWTDMRMRAPVVPALALLAASALRPGPGSARRWIGSPDRRPHP